MAEWEAPAKLNLDLRLASPAADGMHPLHSLVVAVDWVDVLSVEEGEEDFLEVGGADLPAGGENLIWRAVETLAVPARPALAIHLRKQIAVAAGLGGGSSDAAAALLAVADLVGLDRAQVIAAAPEVGADVPFFLTGGACRMEGYGERLTHLEPLEGFAVGVAVPPFELATARVYRRWDELEGPLGEETAPRLLPPVLRPCGALRNDLTPAAVDLLPELADWMRDLRELWSRPVFMTGSGPACFSYFLDLDEGEEAVAEVDSARSVAAVTPRRGGVSRRP